MFGVWAWCQLSLEALASLYSEPERLRACLYHQKPLKDVSLNNNHRRNDNQKTQSSSRYRLQSPQSMHSQNLTKAAEVGGRVTNLLAEDVSFTTPGRGGTLPSRSVCGGTPLIVSVALSRASASSSQSSKDFDLPATGLRSMVTAPSPRLRKRQLRTPFFPWQ